MSYIAHTPPKDKPEIAPHLYADHISEALKYGLDLFDFIISYSSLNNAEQEILRKTLTTAIMLHDLGKLDEKNQAIFRGEATGRLPIDHIESGVAIADEMKNELLAWLIRGHHAPGLTNKKSEKYFIKQLIRETGYKLSVTCLRGLRHKRIKSQNYKEDFFEHLDVIKNTNEQIEIYKKRQLESCSQWSEHAMKLPDSGLLTRILLSCLVDADHGSAASYSDGIGMPNFSPARTQWEKRLKALNLHVAQLGNNANKKERARNKIRGEFYNHCYTTELFDSKIISCSAPVGLGKTTSVMAYLLRKAIKEQSSRIFVIAPFSNIINQTVKVLRNSVVLEGEEAEKTVVAHHHKANFSDKAMRQYAASWQAPIVVTTAVQFFETLASSDPTQLRKLSSIAGSSIFIDESHACLPVELLNLTWYWLRELSENWACNIVFSSGSMVEYWSNPKFVGINTLSLPDLLPEDLRLKTQETESYRVQFECIEKSVNLSEMIALLQSEKTWSDSIVQAKPSCMVILNTVQSAAIVADALARSLNEEKKSLQNKKVLHLSTALAPKDREIILGEISRRQGDTEWDKEPWYLIATSCVEAGVDLDFAIGFREKCSVTSFLQVAGRINRHGRRDFGILVSFSIIPEDNLIHHPGFKESIIVFDDLWDEIIDPKSVLSELSTKAISREFLNSTTESN